MSVSDLKKYFTSPLKQVDPDIYGMLEGELEREKDGIELIASENMVSQAVLQAQGSVLTNKYAEGYPGRRYYGGCGEVDKVEECAIERVKKIFSAGYANVQPHSGANANQAAFMALVKPGDTVMGMSLAAGGHLTHGARPNFSGKWFHAVSYGVRKEDGRLDYEEMKKVARETKPKMIIAGGSAYPRIIDFQQFRDVADEVGAYLMVDMAHFAGLVAAGLYPNPIKYADIVTSTTHKTLRGPRGGLVLTNNPELAKKINSAVFPGLQGGPLMHIIAAKAVAFGEALHPNFVTYQQNVKKNAQTLAKALREHGFDIVTEGTDTHLLLVDLRPKNVTGRDAEQALERASITVNKNAIPFDPQKPMVTSGIRLGSPAATTRGFGTKEFKQIAHWIDVVLTSLSQTQGEGDPQIEQKVSQEVQQLCRDFPVYN